MNDLVNKAKLALRITADVYYSELDDLIEAAKLDLGIAGVLLPQPLDPLVERAIITYVKVNFGTLSDGEYTRLKASYDEQKAQLQTSSKYTEWGASSG